MSWSSRGLEHHQLSHDLLARYVTTQCHEFVECFFLLLRRTKSATAKFLATAKLETICFANFGIFHVYLFHIYFECKC